MKPKTTNETKADTFLNRIKNNRLFAFLIVVGTVCVAIVSFAESVQKAGQLFGVGQTQVRYDADTKEAIIAVAKKIDRTLLEFEDAVKAPSLEKFNPTYLDIQADLDSILLRNQLRPLNDESVAAVQTLIDDWKYVKTSVEIGEFDVWIPPDHSFMDDDFNTALMLEQSKNKPK